MKAHIALLIVGILFIATNIQAQNIQALMPDEDLVKQQIKCILGEEGAVCDAIGERLKRMLPDFLNNNCGHCTLSQKAIANVVAEFMKNNYKKEWEKIVPMYTVQQR